MPSPPAAIVPSGHFRATATALCEGLSLPDHPEVGARANAPASRCFALSTKLVDLLVDQACVEGGSPRRWQAEQALEKSPDWS